MRIDILTGGFPCQDISLCGEGAGIEGQRSGLWREMWRLIREVRPRYVVMENVSALTHRGLGDILGALASIGYDAEWDCIHAAAVGAPQLRDRTFLVAYPHGERTQPERYIFTPARFTSPRRRHVDGLDLADGGPWSSLPGVRRMDYGIPGTMDRVSALGNAIVPQVAAEIFTVIRDMEEE